MGNTSEKSATLVAGVDYHVVRYKGGQLIPAGWIMRRTNRNIITSDIVKEMLTEKSLQPSVTSGYSSWVVFPGPKPDKRWGPVCP